VDQHVILVRPLIYWSGIGGTREPATRSQAGKKSVSFEVRSHLDVKSPFCGCAWRTVLMFLAGRR